MPADISVDMLNSVCPDDYPDKTDPLYVLGCTQNYVGPSMTEEPPSIRMGLVKAVKGSLSSSFKEEYDVSAADEINIENIKAQEGKSLSEVVNVSKTK